MRAALEHELERLAARASFDARNARAYALADRIGPPNPAFDEKSCMDEMWGE